VETALIGTLGQEVTATQQDLSMSEDNTSNRETESSPSDESVVQSDIPSQLTELVCAQLSLRIHLPLMDPLLRVMCLQDLSRVSERIRGILFGETRHKDDSWARGHSGRVPLEEGGDVTESYLDC